MAGDKGFAGYELLEVGARTSGRSASQSGFAPAFERGENFRLRLRAAPGLQCVLHSVLCTQDLWRESRSYSMDRDGPFGAPQDSKQGSCPVGNLRAPLRRLLILQRHFDFSGFL